MFYKSCEQLVGMYTAPNCGSSAVYLHLKKKMPHARVYNGLDEQ